MGTSGRGHLEYGETLEAAARRELLEETGLSAANFVFNSIVNRSDEHSQYLHISFLAEGVRGEPAPTPECSEWRWFPLGELPDTLFPWNADPIAAFLGGRLLVDNVRK